MCEIFIAPTTNSVNIISLESIDGISFLRVLDLKYEEPRFACLVTHSITNKNIIKTINKLNESLMFKSDEMSTFINTLDVVSKAKTLTKIPVIRINDVFLAIGVLNSYNDEKTIVLEFFKSQKDLDNGRNAYSLQLTETMLKKFVSEMEKLLYKTI